MITLYGIADGRAGKAWVFLADNWQEFEFLPASNAWFEPDPHAETPGRGWMKIADWLAYKNRWSEMEPAEPSEYARVSKENAVRGRGELDDRLHVRPPADYHSDEEVRRAWDNQQLGLLHGWGGPRAIHDALLDW